MPLSFGSSCVGIHRHRPGKNPRNMRRWGCWLLAFTLHWKDEEGHEATVDLLLAAHADHRFLAVFDWLLGVQLFRSYSLHYIEAKSVTFRSGSEVARVSLLLLL